MMKALDDFSAAFNAAERRRQSNVIRDKTRPEGSWPEPGLRHSEPVRTPAWESVSAPVSVPAVPRRDNHDVYHAVKQPAAPEFTHSAGSFGGTATKTPAQDKSADGGAGDLTHRSGKLDDLTGRLAGMPSYQEATEDDYPRTFWGEIRHALSPQEIGRSGRQLGDIQTAMATDDVMDPLESAAFSAFRPALSTGEAFARSIDRDFGDEASHRRMDELGDRLDATLKKAEEAHPLAYAFGGAVGTIPLVNGVAAAVGAIPGVDTLPSVVRSGLIGGTVMGGSRFAEGIGGAAAGRTDAREFTRGVLDSTAVGALGGAAMTAVGNAIGSMTRRRLQMKDFVDPDSPVWNNVPYEDTVTQSRIMQETHREMVEAGQTVTVPSQTLEDVAKYYPDLRTMPKAERTPILRQAMKELKGNLRQFLNSMKGSYDFEVNGNILEARLYDTGVREVMQGVTQPKASMLYSSREIFRNARYLYSTPDYAGDPNIFRWNYFYTPVQIGDETVGVRIALRDVTQGWNRMPESQIYHWGLK